MPRGLTEQEKESQRQLLISHGRKLIIRYGISRVSVDDIVKEAGMAKGSFYNFFSSKDDFLYHLVFQLHEQGFARIKTVLRDISQLPSAEKRVKIKRFFMEMMKDPEQRFFIEEHNEVERFMLRYAKDGLAELEAMEQRNYQEMFNSMNLKGKQPEILQNYIHIIFFGVSHGEILIKEFIDPTIEVMIDGLLDYLEV
ncbi:TetR family transcriptional regulator [Enterococcus florum]|uniref:TetR family transcriptional regulator n=1 Tax=Enterococcus florum TaxID=2480627 RepID=A0A4P5PFK6_9ENTE|nr:TetR/AcrR family transcriptional regulator [Enterococcus florum]GCF95544.1 TetR family transcriptional regulator [Enterococcus florum]